MIGKNFVELEDGNDFDGLSIGQTFRLGDMALVEGSVGVETKVEYTCLISTAKSTTSNSITFTHYRDGQTTGTTWTKSPQASGYNLAYPVEHHDQKGAGVFHSIKAALSTNDETVGFEPLYLYMLYSTQRDHAGDWRL